MALFTFEHLFFTVGSGEKQKTIIQGISHSIERGQVVAILGPSGSGKTTLLNVLALRAGYGKAYGTIKLHGKNYTGKDFKDHAYYVQQYDKNWDNLTVYETMAYAARMFGCKKEDLDMEVTELITSMGLKGTEKTRCKGLSGGQQRRLSLAISLLKKPDLLFLDEITSGLDSVSSLNVCRLLRKVADERNIAVVCTIHQPSTKTFHNFDQVMVLSMGRLAYAGSRIEAENYFANMGYTIPPMTSESEHYLNTVDADFGTPEDVQNILNAWTEHTSINSKSEGFPEEKKKIEMVSGEPSKLHFGTLLSRQVLLIMRDPTLYLGRGLAFLAINAMFSFVYWNTRDMIQLQALNKAHLIMWWLAAPSICGVIAVVFINQEIKAVLSEVKNGMYNVPGYILARNLLILPIMILFGILAIAIPAFVIMPFDASKVVPAIGIWSLHILSYESFAECLAVVFDDVLYGMLSFLGYWVFGFLCCGVFLPAREMFWPVKLFYYLSNFGYYGRSIVNLLLEDETFDSCDRSTNVSSPVCTSSTKGTDVLKELTNIIAAFEDKDYARDTLCIVAIILGTKLLFVLALVLKAKKVHLPMSNPDVPLSQREEYAASMAQFLRGGKTKELDAGTLLELFNSVDKDRSGSIDKEEFFEFTQSCEYCNIGRRDCVAIFNAIDIDGDEELTFPEFSAFFKSLPVQSQDKWEDNSSSA